MKNFSLFFSWFFLIAATSCSQNEAIENTIPQESFNIVEFKTMDEFNNTVENLLQSSEEEQIAWCKEKGFCSQNMLYDQALEELENIQNLRDTAIYYKALDNYKKKYSKYFVFNENKEDNDLSPYIPSNNIGAYLVCNANGEVKIGGKIKKFNELESFEETNYGKYIRGVGFTRNTIDERDNYLYIKEGGDRKMWAEAQRKQRGVYIKYSAHKKGWLGGWNKYKTTYFTQYISHDPLTWTSIERDFQMYIDNKNIMVESNEVKSGTTVFLGNTHYNFSTGEVLIKGVAKFKCTSRGTYGEFGYLQVNI